jgi:bifunctional non-homologous end joining protein LigD
LVQFNVLEIHVWGSRSETIDRPDRIVFDLDPDPSVSWESVVETAFFVRDALAEFGLVSFVKTTGGKGLHVTAPVERRHDWDQVGQFAKAFADLLASVAPSRYTSNPTKSARRGKIYIDYLRNGRGSTAVAPYSTRAKDAATVSCPLAWDELSSVSSPAAFTVRNMPRRVALVEDDPWREMGSVRQTITAATRKRLGLR